VAFIRYATKADADAARSQMQDYPQAAGSEKHIRVEFAKSNSKPPKHPRQWYSASPAVDAYASAGMKRSAMEANPYAQYAASYAQYSQQQYPSYAHASPASPAAYAQPDWQAFQSPAYGAAAGYYQQQQQQQQQQYSSGSGNAPCNTLFVANVPADIPEAELSQIFGACTGFKRLRLSSMRGAVTAFIEFLSDAFASRALQQMQGQRLRASAAPLRIEYSKRPMGTPGKAAASAGFVPLGAAAQVTCDV